MQYHFNCYHVHFQEIQGILVFLVWFIMMMINPAHQPQLGNLLPFHLPLHLQLQGTLS